MVPWILLWLRFKSRSSWRFAKLGGRGPSRLLFPMCKFKRFRRFPKLSGTGPSNLFSYRERSSNFVRFPIEDGIGPMKLLDSRYRMFMFLRYFIHPWIVPVKLLWFSESLVIPLSFPMLWGTCPDKLFPANRSCSRLDDRLPTVSGSTLYARESTFRGTSFQLLWWLLLEATLS